MPKRTKSTPNVEIAGDPPVQFEVAWQLPYVIKSIYSQLEAVANAQLAPFGISISVWRILAALWNHEELTNRELARFISIDVANLSRVSRVIQRDGLIVRRRTADDQRAVRIRLTRRGKELVERIIPHATEWHKEVMGDFSGTEMTTLMPLLSRIAANLTKYVERRDGVEGAAGVPAEGDSAISLPARKIVKRRSMLPRRS